MALDKAQADAFVTTWVAAWNRHDLDGVMAMVHDDVEFISPFVIDMFDEPSGVLKGKEALRSWFAQALAAWPEFTIDPPLYVLSSVDTVCLVERINDTVAANVFTLDSQGLVTRSIVHG